MSTILIVTIILGAVAMLLILRRPKNTKWMKCTKCHHCNIVYNRSGLHPSIYVCPQCGEDTDIFCSFRYKDGEIETKERKR